MKFIFPKNYKYNAKILGFIDYSTAIFDAIVGVILFLIIHVIFQKISTQIYVFIILFMPIFLFSVYEARGDNIIFYILSIVKFIKNRNIYVYEKRVENEESKKR